MLLCLSSTCMFITSNTIGQPMDIHINITHHTELKLRKWIHFFLKTFLHFNGLFFGFYHMILKMFKEIKQIYFYNINVIIFMKINWCFTCTKKYFGSDNKNLTFLKKWTLIYMFIYRWCIYTYLISYWCNNTLTMIRH